jgi:diguanylate cyclase (GGDEF)-like protein/PAS domain S-box-containing protein
MHESDTNKERLELALEAAGLDLWENNLVTGEVTRKVTKIFAELGYSEDEAVSYVDAIFKIVHPDDVPNIKAAVHDHVTGRSAQYRCEFRIRAKDGRWVWFANYGKIMDRDQAESGQRFIGVTFNIDDRKRRESELAAANRKLTRQNELLEKMNLMLQSLSTTDPLTGIANRRRIMDMGVSEAQRAVRLGHPLSLLVVDIDLFKQVNDTWGHPIGDRVICAVADACVRSVRRDVDIVGRIGGEEFALILPETSENQAYQLAERLCASVAALPIAACDNLVLSVTVSIGVATLSSSCTSFRDLLIRADRALYGAKDSGRNCVYLLPA